MTWSCIGFCGTLIQSTVFTQQHHIFYLNYPVSCAIENSQFFVVKHTLMRLFDHHQMRFIFTYFICIPNNSNYVFCDAFMNGTKNIFNDLYQTDIKATMKNSISILKDPKEANIHRKRKAQSSEKSIFTLALSPTHPTRNNRTKK